MGYLTRALKLRKESELKDSGAVFDDLLHIPQANLKKPLCIESGYLKDTLYLVANEAQAQEIEAGGGVAYTPGEVKTLLLNSAGMDEGELKDYLSGIHSIKKTFSSRVQP